MVMENSIPNHQPLIQQQQTHQHHAQPQRSQHEVSNSAATSTPSPQSVGREFVRQYYTLLNQAPLHLHRFYSSDSSFVHGNMDDGSTSEPVKGQQEIHEKIMQLNFRDCHAKIRQVDAHSTLGDGVVVQVSGELSNNGQEMRRFMQTFVLAPQSPKKYYVINDIFRYQDEVFGSQESTNAVANQQHIIQQQQLLVSPSSNSMSTNSNNMSGSSLEVESSISMGVPVAASTSLSSGTDSHQSSDVLMGSAGVIENGTNENSGQHTQSPVKNNEPLVNDLEQQQSPQGNQGLEGQGVRGTPTVSVKEHLEEPVKAENAENMETSAEVSDTSAKDEKTENVFIEEQKKPEAEDKKPEAENKQPVSNEPLSYANRVKSGSTSGNQQGPANSGPPSGAHKVTGAPNKPPSGSEAGINNKEGGKFKSGAQRNAGTGGRRSRGERYRSEGGDENQVATMPMSYTERRRLVPQSSNPFPNSGSNHVNSSGSGNNNHSGNSHGSGNANYPDSHQLFVGNLPHNCTEEELEKVFSKFGKVAEIRINSKGASQTKTMPSGARVPNFGFVVFENDASVSDCLKKRPIFLPPDNHRLNVEEKKNKQQMRTENFNHRGSSFERGSQEQLVGGTGVVGGGSGSNRGGGERGGRGGRGSAGSGSGRKNFR